ncbi:uncharacterized protein C9orf131 homolog [Psammomys obesus]|uniref:uncharacterized protein C9orf131 homolog n=1 Tax=Psammomys obesus TaxID=48139 RepID=UPI00245355DC|nr:uncharacterized protein C9orf131 homolog [Psammomys obesus]
MEWLLEDLLRDKGDMGLLQGQLTHALACRHCSSSICLQSPGNLGLQLLHHLTVLDCLWKQKSEEEEDGEEKEELSLDPQKPYFPSKDPPTGNQLTAAPAQPSCSFEGLPKATEPQEQVLAQPSSPSRSFPTFQILTNLPVRNKIASGRSLQQRKSQLFWGLPSLHSESLETIFLSSEGPSPRKLSICPSVFFNKVAFLPVYKPLFPSYHSSTCYPTPEAHMMEDLEGTAPSSQSSPPIPLVSSNLKPLPMACKGIISDTKAHTQWFSHNNEVSCVSESRALYPQPQLQNIRPSTFLCSSEAWREMSGDPSLHQHNPESPSASLSYPANPQEVLNRFKVPWITMKNEHPKASECTMPTASPHPTCLTKCHRVNPIGDLSGLKALWETTMQKENPQRYEIPILAPCQFTVPMTEPQGTEPQGTHLPGTPPRYETQRRYIVYKDNPQAFDPLMSVSYQPSDALSEVKHINPKGRLSAPKDFWGNIGYKGNPPVSKSPVSDPCPLDTLSGYQKESPLEDLSGYEAKWQCRENSGNLWAFKTPTLNNFNMGFYETTPECVPLGSKTHLKGRPSTKNSCVYADLVSSPSLPSASLPDFAIMGPQRVLLEPKALWETKEQRKHLWVSDSPHPAHIPPLVPQRINTVDDFPTSAATWKDTGNTGKCLSSEHPLRNLNPYPDLAQQTLRLSPIENSFKKSKAWCGDSQRKNLLTSELPAQSLSQYLLGARPSEILSNFKPAEEHMQQNENCSVSASSVWEFSLPPNSQLSEPSEGQCNSKPMESAVEQRRDFWVTELPSPSFFSAPSQEPHSNIEFLCRNVQEKEASQGPNPPVENPLQPTSILAKAPKSGLQKEKILSEAKVEASSSQSGAVPEVCDQPVIHAWQWSRELKLKLKKLQQSPIFKSPGSYHSFCSSPVLKPLTPEPWGLSSCSQQTHPLNLHPCFSSCHAPKIQRTEPLPAQDPHFSHSPSQPQLQAASRAEQESQKNKRMERKVMVQIPPLGHAYMKADENCSAMGESSEVLISGQRQDKTLEILSAQGRGSPRKCKAERCGRGDAELGSSTVTGENHPAQACRPAEAPIHTFSKKSQYKAQSSHTALAQQLLPNASGPWDQQKTKVGDAQNPRHYKRCPSSTSKAPPTRGIQRLLTKFVGVHRPRRQNPVSKSMAVTAPSIP